MEGPHDTIHPQGTGLDSSSDYGSDFGADEEEILNELLTGIDSTVLNGDSLRVDDIENNEDPTAARVPLTIVRRTVLEANLSPRTTRRRVTVELEESSIAPDAPREDPSRQRETDSVEPVAPELAVEDPRSPLERFRTAPKKALSVTDLVSTSWCELQYLYTLAKFGRKRQTPAMRQGSHVHKILEEEVHQTVAVDVQTKEDSWGLRLWNVMQGLQTLRETGMTRELEVWGVLDGLVVNGVIDEVSFTCPDLELEEQAMERRGVKKAPEISPDQTRMTDYLRSAGATSLGDATTQNMQTDSWSSRKVYLTDVKTRSFKSIPKGASFRPTLMQLMLYHRLLAGLASDAVDPQIIWDRYQLDPSSPFSDALIAQLSSLNEPFFDSNPNFTGSSPSPSQDTVQILLEHNSLAQFWRLMTSELRRAFPMGRESIGDVLKVEYRMQEDGSIVGVKTFLYDDCVLQPYLDDELKWWRGERATQGVVVEEAYKCKFCEFSEDCSWRIAKVEEARQLHRARQRENTGS